jgi:hypothetical protein
MVETVYNISLELTEEMKATALFWDDFPDGKTVTSGGHWASILSTVQKERRVRSIIEAAKEAGMSRLYGGIHYLPSIETRFGQGQKVADNVSNSLVFKSHLAACGDSIQMELPEHHPDYILGNISYRDSCCFLQ